MTYNPDTHHRHSIRLQGYDYSRAGAYFVTLCAHERECLFGEIVSGEMRLNDFGRIVMAEWIRSSELRAEVETGEYVVMPNHFHGIVIIRDIDHDHIICRGDRPVAPTMPGPQPKSIGAMMAGFKSAVTKQINVHRNTPSVPVWQRNYYEHVIRDDADYARITEYIVENPQRWNEDKLHPENYDTMTHSGNTGHGNNDGSGNIDGNGDIVGATGRSPLRTVPHPGGHHE